MNDIGQRPVPDGWAAFRRQHPPEGRVTGELSGTSDVRNEGNTRAPIGMTMLFAGQDVRRKQSSG